MTSPPSASSSPASLQGNRELDPPRPKQGAAGGGRRAPWGTAPARALPMAVLFQPGPARHMDRPRSLASTSPGRHEHAGPLFACVGNAWTPRERRLAKLTGGRERGEGGRECSHCVRVCALVCAACKCACRWRVSVSVGWSLALGPGPWPSALVLGPRPCADGVLPCPSDGPRGPYPHLSLCAITTHVCVYVHMCSCVAGVLACDGVTFLERDGVNDLSA